MYILNQEVFGFRAAIRSMRNPMDSWDKSDTDFIGDQPCLLDRFGYHLGPKDLELARKLIHGGSEHRKFIRLIQVWATLEIPRYVWTEFDTYKVGATRMSCSTMHKLGTRELTYEDFENGAVLKEVLHYLNDSGKVYRETKDYEMVRAMKANLPESFLQRADVNFNYETAFNIYQQRKNHRLPEWHKICNWLESLPLFKEFFLNA